MYIHTVYTYGIYICDFHILVFTTVISSSSSSAQFRSNEDLGGPFIYIYTDYSCNFMMLHAQVFRWESNP